MMRHARRAGLWIAFGVIGLWVLVGSSADLWSGSQRPVSAGGLSPTAQAAPGEAEGLQASFIRIAKEVGPSVVSISTEQVERVRQYFRVHPFFGFGPEGEDPFEEFFRQFEGPGQEFRRFGLGSGLIIDDRGYVLTNEHVVADADKITVTLSDGREFAGEVKGKDSRSDLAIIKVDVKLLASARLGDSGTVRTGQWAIALGNPFGLMSTGTPGQGTASEPTLTVGVVSALNRQLPRMSKRDRDYSDLIQTDAAINPGNSGGPLLNLQGEVIGINVAILTSSRGYEGIGFAIPSNKAKRVLETLISGQKVQYGWLGIQIQDITQDVAEYYSLSDRQGVLVFQVLPDSPAEKAGMKDGDLIKLFDGQPIEQGRQLIDRVSQTKVGRSIQMELLRDGKRMTLSVEIGERPVDVEGAGAATTEAWRGLTVADITPDQIERYDIPAGSTGVFVIGVEEGSPAEQAGIRPGDVINEINRVRIESVSDYRKATAEVRGNALVRTNRGYFVVKAGG